MTPSEAALWAQLRGGKLGSLRFRRQQVIGPFIADFYCHTAALVVEVDGPIHDSETLIERDGVRDAVFAERGLRCLHITNDEIARDLTSVLNRILSAAQPEQHR